MDEMSDNCEQEFDSSSFQNFESIENDNGNHDYAGSKEYEHKKPWDEDQTALLISLTQKCLNKVGRGLEFTSKREMHEHISRQMKAHGHSFSATQIDNRIKTLKRKVQNNRPIIKTQLKPIPKETKTFIESLDLENTQSEGPPEKKFHMENIKMDCTENNSKLEDIDNNDKRTSSQINKAQLNVLSALIKKYSPKIGYHSKLKTKRQLCEYLVEKMRAEGYSLTALQIEQKWKYLRNYYDVSDEDEDDEEDSFERDSDDSFATDDDTKNKSPRTVTTTVFEKADTDAYVEEIEDPISYPEKHELDLPSTTLLQNESSIAHELSLYRKMSTHVYKQKLKLRKAKVRAYKERTREIKKIGDLISGYLEKQSTQNL